MNSAKNIQQYVEIQYVFPIFPIFDFPCLCFHSHTTTLLEVYYLGQILDGQTIC